MSDCCSRGKVKNACMVCKRTVTAKTGLQCQGSCKSWIHFTCCSYTPGKIKDIKAKVIKVRCPCPDCSNTEGPKEVVMLKDSSFTCVNKTCPINIPPECQDGNLNKMNQQPSPCTFSCKEWPGVPCSANTCSVNTQDDCCPEKSRAHPIPHQQPPSCPPSPPPAPCIPAPQACPQPPPCPPPKPCTPGKTASPAKPCSKTCSPAPTTPPHASNSSSPARRMSPSSTPVMPSISLVENMCETVGLLSNQLNQLMCKMTEVLNPSNISQQTDFATPCRCPKNPGAGRR
ncbi:keratinocyte proline-rich protein-like [Cydia strobilella]|uniref:keratinocyte proline-rich protein-like n=1 Tax=Cydia strobilella TaxID=1100964 RepID=UPI00300408A6